MARDDMAEAVAKLRRELKAIREEIRGVGRYLDTLLVASEQGPDEVRVWSEASEGLQKQGERLLSVGERCNEFGAALPDLAADELLKLNLKRLLRRLNPDEPKREVAE